MEFLHCATASDQSAHTSALLGGLKNREGKLSRSNQVDKMIHWWCSFWPFENFKNNTNFEFGDSLEINQQWRWLTSRPLRRQQDGKAEEKYNHGTARCQLFSTAWRVMTEFSIFTFFPRKTDRTQYTISAFILRVLTRGNLKISFHCFFRPADRSWSCYHLVIETGQG